MSYLWIIPFLFIGKFVSCQSLLGKISNLMGSPISDVNITKKSSEIHSHTNHLGEFTISPVFPGDTLVISHLLFESSEYIVSNHGHLFLQLKSKKFLLEDVVISSSANELEKVAEIDLQIDPVKSSQEILRSIPGLFIGQHAGGGKAEQLFLRGFDIDHGTDIAISVDGLPVNMVSHTHGQGYADLHFLIPETVQNINFGKGPYSAGHGNFSTAGYVNFETKDRLENSLIQTEIGDFGTFRTLGMFDLFSNENHSFYLASDYIQTDGPFESPQNFHRINLFGKYSGKLENGDLISFSSSYFDSKWDASGQIPIRAVESGMITRFGAIDDTEGGITSRTNLQMAYTKYIDQYSYVKNTLSFSQYSFELYSNFSFFANDSVNGDQIRQKEMRNMIGLTSVWNRTLNDSQNLRIGVSLRNDQSADNELSHSLQRRTTLEIAQLGDINETNLSAFFNLESRHGKWLINPSLRIDHFEFKYNDHLASKYQTLSNATGIASPKMNLVYNHSNKWQLYLKSGFGFHSNDTRVVIFEENEILPRALGTDIGFIWKPFPNMFVNAAYWYLYLEQEFVYVGDEGIVEPSGKTRRNGLDIGLRFQPATWIFANFDMNFSKARSIGEPEGKNLIPLAPNWTSAGGIHIDMPSGIVGSLKYRYLGTRPANEDQSIVAKGYFVMDANLEYQWNSLSFGIQLDNLLNQEWNEAQFATQSQFASETMPVEEIHFTPGMPRFVKAIVRYSF